MRITFLVPSDACSGGVRVTVQMGNYLLKRGHEVRVAYRTCPMLSVDRFRSLARSAKLYCQGVRPTSWLRSFKGKREAFLRLEEMSFERNEVVIATGIHTIEELSHLKRDVRKVRFCHGLLEHEPEHKRKMWLWSGKMDTIAVSPVLLPALTKLCEGRVLGVVPNGVSMDEYFVEDRARDGIGMVFGLDPVKGPEVAVALMKALQTRYPLLPRYAFGIFPKAKELSASEYTRYPSVEKAREIYNRSRIWVVTSRDEGFCLPMLEGMACGCAVISSQHSNAGELITNGVNGFCVAYGDVAGYLENIMRLLEDEKLRATLVDNGFKTVGRFTWDIAADHMEEALHKLS